MVKVNHFAGQEQGTHTENMDATDQTENFGSSWTC